jgi:hypothetical protein
MTINMPDNSAKRSLAEIKEFLTGSVGLEFQSVDKIERNNWIEQVLIFHNYQKCHRLDKGCLRQYIMRISGLKRAHVNRLIGQFLSHHCLKKCPPISATKRHCFPRKYLATDVRLLAEVDNAHARLSGPATIKILKREVEIFGNTDYALLQNISVSQLYRLRTKQSYTRLALTFEKTNPTKVPIGERRRPEPNGKPGYLCVDSVHQGDSKGGKGIYHINITDIVTQFEFIGSVEAISEKYMVTLLADLIRQFPFVIYEIHSDNGSEYINKTIAKLLNELLIKQTKSRPRHSNDNGLAETKNGALVRKHIGYIYIAKQHTELVNNFYQKTFNTYINYHRPCGFATSRINAKGKETKCYLKENYLTPYEKFKSLPDAQQYLKSDITFPELDKIATAQSDTEYAKMMQVEKSKMFKIIHTNP